MSILRTRKVTPLDGETNLALGDSGDTITIPAGATITNSGTANGFGGGKVLQVVSDTGTPSTSSTTSTSYIDLDTIGTITPSATSSKILIIHSYECYAGSGANDAGFRSKIVRNGTTDVGPSRLTYEYDSADTVAFQANCVHTFLDSPSSTSAVQYNQYLRAEDYSNPTCSVQTNFSWHCILMEIEG